MGLEIYKKIGSRGEIVIPKFIRSQLGLCEGAAVIIRAMQDKIELILKRKNPVEDLKKVALEIADNRKIPKYKKEFYAERFSKLKL